jgi:hypothetical protein
VIADDGEYGVLEQVQPVQPIVDVADPIVDGPDLAS